MKGKSYLNNSDKIITTVTLWVTAVALLATALTLPMLPEKVTIVYKTVDMADTSYSKYNNLLMVLFSLIPAAILLVAVSFKKRNRLHNNFISTVIFCMMMSMCMGGVTIYGILQQFNASGVKQTIDNDTLIAVTVAMIFSVLSATLPMVFASRTFIARSTSRKMFAVYICDSLDRHWNVGAYGFLVAGLASSFIPGPLAYAPVSLCVIFVFVFTLVIGYMRMKHTAETKIYDLLD